jgi:two-component system chemotaxis response regulator CheB
VKPIRVLIVEDSAVIRELLQHLIGRDSRLEVCAAVSSAEAALSIVEKVAPDVISLDIRLPGMDGLEATRRIMSLRPTPIVVVSAAVETEELKIAMRALEAGALAVLEKPVGTNHKDYEEMAGRLCTQLAIMSQVRVLHRHRRAAQTVSGVEPKPSMIAPTWTLAAGSEPLPSGFEILGVVCSTGGPGALVELLGGLGAGFPLPILVVQHMTPSFLEGFASWLRGVCPFAVKIATEGEALVSGCLYMAPPDRHLSIRAGVLALGNGAPVCAQRPSGSILFQSMARSLGPRALGVVMTGMGEDGAEGLLEMRQAGGYTIAEDPSTALVSGMPQAAVTLGAARESLRLSAIASRLLQLVSPAMGVV